MRPSEYPEEDVIEAGKKLDASGRRVTGFAIRKELGGGNATRLKNVWDAYRQSQEVVEAEPVQELPVEVQDALEKVTGDFVEQFRQLVASLNAKAVKTAERRVSEVISTAKKEQDKAEAELADAEVAVEEIENQLSDLQARLDAAETKNAELSKQLSECEKLRAVGQEKIESLSEQLHQKDETLAAFQSQMAQAKEHHQETKSQLDKLQSELIRIASGGKPKTK